MLSYLVGRYRCLVFVCASSESSDETAQKCRLVRIFVFRISEWYHFHKTTGTRISFCTTIFSCFLVYFLTVSCLYDLLLLASTSVLEPRKLLGFFSSFLIKLSQRDASYQLSKTNEITIVIVSNCIATLQRRESEVRLTAKI